jgi:hypothetical protein
MISTSMIHANASRMLAQSPKSTGEWNYTPYSGECLFVDGCLFKGIDKRQRRVTDFQYGHRIGIQV